MRRSRRLEPGESIVIVDWIPVVCDCGKIVIEVSVDRRWLRYICGDRGHNGDKVYQYFDLLNGPLDDVGRLNAVAHQRMERQHG